MITININFFKAIINILFIILTIFILLKNNNVKPIYIKFNNTDSTMNNFYPNK